MKADDVNRLIKQAEQPLVKTYAGGKPNYCTPVEWVGLTREEINELARWADEHAAPWHLEFARAIEAKLKEKNSP